jgi:hypothetical protein
MAKKDGFGHEKPNEGETNDWITPRWIIDAFDKKAGDKGMYFDLDPCASITQPWPCARNAYTIEQDGLLQNWYGTVWCNPPYGANVGTWAHLMAKHNNGIMLIFARVETQAWFDEIFPTASGFLFPMGRIAFCRPDGTMSHESGAPSAFVSWGSKCRGTLIELCDEGMKDHKRDIRRSAFLDMAFYTGSYRSIEHARANNPEYFKEK